MLKLYKSKIIIFLWLFCSLSFAEGMAENFSGKGPKISNPAYNKAGILQDKDATSTLINLSSPITSDAINQFPVLKFKLADAGGDGLPTSLGRIVLKVKENGIGIVDAEGLRMEDVLENIYLTDLENSTDVYPDSLVFHGYNTLEIHFPESAVQVLEGLSGDFELFARLKVNALIKDHDTFSLEANVNSFQTGISSSALSASNNNFEGRKINFEIEASVLKIEEEPALVRAVKSISPIPDGEEFYVKILAVDINGRKDIDFADDITLSLKENGELGRELLGDDAGLYPELTNGEVIAGALMYKGNNIPEFFQLEVNASKLPDGTAFSEPIYAVESQDSNSKISVVAGSGTTNIDYIKYLDSANLNESTSVALGVFKIEDSPGFANDKLSTTLTGMELFISNPENLRTIALFNGSTNLIEQSVDLEENGLIHLENFLFQVLNNKSENLTIRASFKDTVSDNEKVAVRINKVFTDPIGSQFGYTESIVPETEMLVVGGNEADDVNRIEVNGKSIQILALPEKAETGEAFSLSIEAIDEYGNRDLDIYSTIEIKKATGQGIITPASHQQNMNAGYLEVTGLVADEAGVYSLFLDDVSTFLSSTITNYFKVYAPYSYEGLLISEIGQGTENGTPNYLELYNASATESYGLENLELRVYENGGTSPAYRISFNSDASLAVGESYVISNVAFSEEWGVPFAVQGQQVNTGMVGNGNDVYEVYDLYHEKVVDIFGFPGENGNGKNWNYFQKLVNRRSGTTIGNGGEFDISEFTIVPYAHIIANPGLSLTTELNAPSIESLMPANGSQEVMENSPFTFTYNEALNFEDKAVYFVNKSTNDTIYTARLFDPAVCSGEGTTNLTIQPIGVLPSSTEIGIRFEEGAVTDLAGNAIPVMSYSFKTTDSIKPVLLSLEPDDNAVDAALEPVFRMIFSEEVAIGNGDISLYSADGSLLSSFPVTSGFVRHPAPNIIEFEPIDRLEKLSSYYIITSEGLVKDLAGNLFSGTKTKQDWNFKTTDPYVHSPKILTLNPLNGEENVATDHLLKISFHKAVMAGSGAIELYNATTGAFVSSLNPETGEGIDISGEEVQLNFGLLEYNTTYNVVITPGTFKDQDGNPVEGIRNSSGWLFSTVPDANPLLVVQSHEDPLYFGNVAANSTSTAKIYRIGGRNLQEGITLQVPAGFIVSADGGNTYQSGSLQLSKEKVAHYAELIVKFAPQVADGKLYKSQLGHLSKGAAITSLAVLGREGAKPSIISVVEARALGVGENVQLRATVTGGTSFGNDSRFVQDTTAAIALYKPADAVLASLEIGASILVSGIVEQSAEGLLQISGETFHVVVEQTASEIPGPAPVYASQLNEELESQFLELRNLRFEQAGMQFRLNQTYHFTDTKGNRGMLMIKGMANSLIGTNIPEVASAQGILVQVNEAYILLPRNRTDLQLMFPQITTALPDGKLNFGFVPAGSTSKALRIRVSGRDLAEGIEVDVPEPFQVSTSSVAHFSQHLTLPASANGVDIWVRFAPVEPNGEISIGLAALSSNSAKAVQLQMAGVEGNQGEAVTIAQARVMPLGEEVKVQGIVTTGNSISYHERYLQDATGGIMAYLMADSSFSSIPMGAEIAVSGTLQEYNNLLQIGGSLSWQMLNKEAGEPAPKRMMAAGIGEQNEAQLISLEGIKVLAEGYFEAGERYAFTFPSGEKGWIKIPSGDHPLVGLRLPFQANFKGVLSQIGEEYVVLPRRANDLQATDAVISTSFPEGAMEFFFVPANQPSQAKCFIVDGSQLQGNISLSTISPFQVSTNGTNFGISASILKENASQIKVYVRFNPSLSGGGVSQDSLILQTANGRPVKIPLTGIEGERPEVLTIAQARALGAGEQVKVHGILTSGSDFFAEKRFMQDETGGLQIKAKAAILTGMEAGDKVEVSGTLADQGGLLSLEGNLQISLLQKEAGIPAPRDITEANSLTEINESELLSLASMAFVGQGYFEQGKRYTVQFENGEKAFLRIAGDEHPLVGQIIPARLTVQGILAQKGSNFELWPRSTADLQEQSYAMAILTDAAANGIDLGTSEAGTAGQWEKYTVSGLQLNEDISVTVDAPFELSVDKGQWHESLLISKNALKKDVYIRFNPQIPSGKTYNGTITHSSGGIRENISLQAQEGNREQVAETGLMETFDLCLDLNSFFQYDNAGFAQWVCTEGKGVDNTGAVGIFHNLEEAERNEDWLISPALLISKESRLSFEIARQHVGPDLELMVSTNYGGSGNPAQATWESIAFNLPAPSSTLSFFEKIQDVNLQKYAGNKIHIAFKYSASYQEASAYLIDNLSLQKMPTIGFVEKAVSMREGTKQQLVLTLSHPAPQESKILLGVEAGNGIIYGEGGDFISTPDITAGALSLTVPAGAEEISFELNLFEDLLEEADEQLVLSILETGPAFLIAEEASQLSIQLISNNAVEMSISTARELTEEGNLKNRDVLVKLTGIAYGPNLSESANGVEIRLIDHSSNSFAAITVSKELASGLNYSFQEGDRLEVTGVLHDRQGLAVLNPQLVTVLQQNVPLKSPEVVQLLTEAIESDLVSLENVEVISGWVNKPTHPFTVSVKDEEGRTYLVHIGSRSELFATQQPTGKLLITGFVGQKDDTAPYGEGFFIIPGKKADVKLLTKLKEPLVDVQLMVYPNPASEELYFRASGGSKIERLEIFTLKGSLLLRKDYQEGEGVSLKSLSQGIYMVRIILHDGTYQTNRFSVIK